MRQPVIPGLSAAGDVATDFGFKKIVDEQQKRQPLDEAYTTWSSDPSKKNLKALLDSARPVIDKALTSYGGGDRALSSRAKRLAISAFKNYDPARGTKLQTHLLIRLKPLQRERMVRTTPVAVPERVQFDKFTSDQAAEQFRAEHDRDPSDAELADITGLSTKRLAYIRRYAKGILSEGQMEDPATGISLPGSERVTPEDIWIEFVHHDLDPIDKKIMEWKTGLFGKKVLSTNEVARRLKITPSAVSQRAAKIAMKLEEGRSVG